MISRNNQLQPGFDLINLLELIKFMFCQRLPQAQICDRSCLESNGWYHESLLASCQTESSLSLSFFDSKPFLQPTRENSSKCNLYTRPLASRTCPVAVQDKDVGVCVVPRSRSRRTVLNLKHLTTAACSLPPPSKTQRSSLEDAWYIALGDLQHSGVGITASRISLQFAGAGCRKSQHSLRFSAVADYLLFWGWQYFDVQPVKCTCMVTSRECHPHVVRYSWSGQHWSECFQNYGSWQRWFCRYGLHVGGGKQQCTKAISQHL